MQSVAVEYSLPDTIAAPSTSGGASKPQKPTLSDQDDDIVMHDDIPAWENPSGGWERSPSVERLSDPSAPADLQMDWEGSPTRQQPQSGAANTALCKGPSLQAILVPTGADKQIAVGRPEPVEADSGELEVDPVGDLNRSLAGVQAQAEPAERPIHELLWPGLLRPGGALYSEHTPTPAPGVYELADGDDGNLRTQVHLNLGGIHDYLSAGGEFRPGDADADGDVYGHTHPPSEEQQENPLVAFSDTDSTESGDAMDNLLGGLAGDHGAYVGAAEGDKTVKTVSGEEDDDTDYTTTEPLDVDRVKGLLTMFRERGGFSSDAEADFSDWDIPMEPAPGEAEDVDFYAKLTEPVWKTQEAGECPLKMLQVVHLLTGYKEKHKATLEAFADLLSLLHVLMPPSCLPRSLYMFRKVTLSLLSKTLGGAGFQRVHLCSNPECTYHYDNQVDRECPLCDKPRFETLPGGKEKAIREFRYLGLEQGMRVLLMSRSVGSALQSVDLSGLVDSPYSVFSSKLSRHLCTLFIPGFSDMTEQRQRTVKLRFLESGQVCTDAQWDQYVEEVRDGRRQRTLLLTVEGGCDGFQPFKRRVWSTWMMGYRLRCVNWYDGKASDYEIVTAISEGATEGKAAQTVAMMDAQQLILLSPPSASERVNGAEGAFSLQCSMLTYSYVVSQ